VHPYDVIVLDRDLPEIHGDEVCRTLNREQPDTKVLMVTAARTARRRRGRARARRGRLPPKPFRFAELSARVHALARRAGAARPPVLRHGDLELDTARRAASRAGRDLGLSPKELGVLERCSPPRARW
jgi:DNA-binding response OmpR family regulator